MRKRNRFRHRYPALAVGAAALIAAAVFASTAWSDISARDQYFAAEDCYKALRNSPGKQKYRHNWMRCIRAFQEVHRKNPSGPWAAAGLYQAGVLYQELYKRSGRKADEREAMEIYRQIIEQYPASRYREKASAAIERIPASGSVPKRPEQTVRPTPQAPSPTIPMPSAQPDTATPVQSPDSPSEVLGLRYWSNPNYTRVVIDADRPAAFTHRLLKKDPAIHKPQRLYVDLNNSVLGKNMQKRIPINDELLIDTRAGQYTPDTVRVVVDIKSFSTYKIFSLKNPFRIVLDVWGGTEKEIEPAVVSDPPPATAAAVPDSALAKQFALGVRRIVVDPGHGGRDFGAPGYLKGVHEKDVVLAIGKRLAKQIRDALACEVIMTRSTDRYLTLEERTAIANTQNADLFISIHTNATRDRRAFGIETYFLNLATDEASILVAARENATSAKNISDLQTILTDLMQNAKINESSRLAGHVQISLSDRMQRHYSRIKDLGVKQAPFYVLLGAQMPSILIETSFISNPRECRRLIDAAYQEHLCDAIVEGIRNYIQETNPLAYSATQ